ncbi:hypothetical protein [Micromonospora cremea]|uniref:Uncharacterized protein n=1 Tax=Micromonospora cremea TaxID=709881 RepID=A0A1N5VI05_9ACTN|nr:hypothetical protein [Micromonospora cremea]SIM72390.1 hypothetical protein SAMN04489832_1639 [Micromonospora cremea]
MSGPSEGERPTEPAGPPGVIVFEVATARREGLQLRYGGGPRLNEIRVELRVLRGPGLLGW